MKIKIPAIFSMTLMWLVLHCPAQDLQEQAKAALRKSLHAIASLQRDGGWALAWTQDGQHTIGPDGLQTDGTFAVSTVATSGIGMVYLRAYLLLKEGEYLDVAKQAGDALVKAQLSCGGFPQSFTQDSPTNIPGSFEEGATQNTARFLAELWKVTNETKYAEAALRASGFMLQSQDEHGGFPRHYPMQEEEPRHIVLHGGAMTEAVRSLLYCSQFFGNREYNDAVIRGLDCLRALRGDPPQAGWAPFYTEDGMPVVMEPCQTTVLSTVDTVAVMRLFMDYCIQSGDKTYLRSLPATVDWLKHSQLENGKWAWFYEYGSNSVLECQPDQGFAIKDLYPDPAETHGQGDYYPQETDTLFWVLYDVSPDIIESEYRKSLNGFKQYSQEQILSPIVNALNENGFWLSSLPAEYQKWYADGVNTGQQIQLIHTMEFIKNANALMDSIEME